MLAKLGKYEYQVQYGRSSHMQKAEDNYRYLGYV
jgi:hypothetical protein